MYTQLGYELSRDDLTLHFRKKYVNHVINESEASSFTLHDNYQKSTEICIKIIQLLV